MLQDQVGYEKLTTNVHVQPDIEPKNKLILEKNIKHQPNTLAANLEEILVHPEKSLLYLPCLSGVAYGEKGKFKILPYCPADAMLLFKEGQTELAMDFYNTLPLEEFSRKDIASNRNLKLAYIPKNKLLQAAVSGDKAFLQSFADQFSLANAFGTIDFAFENIFEFQLKENNFPGEIEQIVLTPRFLGHYLNAKGNLHNVAEYVRKHILH